jgi:hypothetical protein
MVHRDDNGTVVQQAPSASTSKTQTSVADSNVGDEVEMASSGKLCEIETSHCTNRVLVSTEPCETQAGNFSDHVESPQPKSTPKTFTPNQGMTSKRKSEELTGKPSKRQRPTTAMADGNQHWTVAEIEGINKRGMVLVHWAPTWVRMGDLDDESIDECRAGIIESDGEAAWESILDQHPDLKKRLSREE